MTDLQIISWIKEGKQGKVLQELYYFYPPVQKFLCNNGASKEEALDVYQDALFILCKKIKAGNFELSAKLSTYLFSVCKFIWKDELNKKNKLVSSDFNFPVHQEEVFLELEEDESEINCAEKALLNIGEKCLAILKSFYHEGWSMVKIAEKYGFSSEKSAKNQKYKCLEKAKIKYNELSTASFGQKI